ncbi:hypothetical protein ARMGADRAFT_1045787 [Armillaria gallica]|uniref:ATP-dependent DNA helicase n=1 Tax=Armillaria gallica TaxID=47427 RepID=A0A2H3E4B3_ARMGA|nr:hypothetical protein ARMGADRAFT_1045787 [Armillaria gallica]
MCTNNLDLPFGGMNVIFAGDFAQLPPVIGRENTSLYRLDNGMYAMNKKAQEAALGKAIWHQVTTVVILRENMRQKTQSDDDTKLRQALANMHYKACTVADIGFLEFRNVSIITRLNIYKDEFNCIGMEQFAAKTGQELVHFYSENFMTDAPVSSARCKNKSKVIKLTAKLQCHMWNTQLCDNNKHIPGRLSLCKGLPMMIRLNSATELAMTKGQDCTVHSWVEATETLFMKLSNPPQDVSIPGLPINVVPLICTLQTITCYFADNSSISKTRPINLVDLTNCQSHQSYYTALSRSTSTEGTILLPDFTDLKLFVFDLRKIQGGCSGHLRQEFHELELLDHMTLLQYEGNIPMSVYGER